MCTTRVLARSKAGFISQCLECKRIHLAFGTAMMSFERDVYDTYCLQINKDVQLIDENIHARAKCLQLVHPEHAEFSVVLTKQEYYQLNDLIQEAGILLTTYNLLGNES